MPVLASSSACQGGAWPNDPRPVTSIQTRATRANGVSTAVSVVRLGSASTCPPTRFFTSPYDPKLAARISEIHGGWP